MSTEQTRDYDAQTDAQTVLETQTVAYTEAPADEPDSIGLPVYYKSVNIPRALRGFTPIEKVGNVYVVRLRRPLLVQTPPVSLASPLEEDGQPATRATLVLGPEFAAFARAVEARILDVCLEHKVEWFRKAVNEDALRGGFKEFCKPGGHLKVCVPRDFLVFDHTGDLVTRASVPEGTRMRCALELSMICFGRTEFGGMWNLVQAQTMPAPVPPPAPRCLIDASVDYEVESSDRPDRQDEPLEFF